MRTEPLIMAVYGTRPEAIKMAPLVHALQRDPRLRVRVAVTGQHRELLDAVNGFFGIEPEFDLHIARPGLSLTSMTAAALAGLSTVFDQARPSAVVVHGDTTTSFVAALAAYYARIPVIHLEAGLRSGDLGSPFPEEGNRRLTAQLTALHLAPTPGARAALRAENVPAGAIAVTGNTVIDALLSTVRRPVGFTDPAVTGLVESGRRIVLLTAHRRESWGEGLRRSARAIARVVAERPDVAIVAPLHPNPLVREAIVPEFAGLDRALVTDPLDYPEFCTLMARAHLVVTDSGGIQEEAPSLAKPVLVTREVTERPEAVAAGAARLVGTDESAIETQLSRVLDDPADYARMSRAINPYGDGRAAERAAAAIAAHFGVGERLPDFDPAAGPAFALAPDFEREAAVPA